MENFYHGLFDLQDDATYFYFYRPAESLAESNSTICTDMDPTIYISGECHSTNNEYYEPSIDIITGNRNQSNQDVDLDDTEVVTMTDNIYYQLYDINQ